MSCTQDALFFINCFALWSRFCGLQQNDMKVQFRFVLFEYSCRNVVRNSVVVNGPWSAEIFNGA